LCAEIEELAAWLVALAEEAVREADGAAAFGNDALQHALFEWGDKRRNKNIALFQICSELLLDLRPLGLCGAARELQAYPARMF